MSHINANTVYGCYVNISTVTLWVVWKLLRVTFTLYPGNFHSCVRSVM